MCSPITPFSLHGPDIKACFDIILYRKLKKMDTPPQLSSKKAITSGKRAKSELTAGRKVKLLLLLYLYKADIHASMK